MAYLGKRKVPFIWVTPSGMKIKFALGKVKKIRAGLGFIRKGSGVVINIVDKDKIDVKKSVVALMPNFIHSLDACSVHEITNFLHNLIIDETTEDLIMDTRKNERHWDSKNKEDYLFDKFTYDQNDLNDPNKVCDYSPFGHLKQPSCCGQGQKDNTFFDKDLVEGIDLIKVGAFKNNIPLYTIHDCFATTPNNMELIKSNVTLLFSEMYFSTPYIKILHLSLLKQILSYDDIFGYPIEIITDKHRNKNDKLIIKDFKKVNIVLDNIIKIDLNYLEDPENRGDIFDNKYYLFTIDEYNNRNLIPLFPSTINDNINKYSNILKLRAGKSTYLIS